MISTFSEKANSFVTPVKQQAQLQKKVSRVLTGVKTINSSRKVQIGCQKGLQKSFTSAKSGSITATNAKSGAGVPVKLISDKRSKTKMLQYRNPSP